MVSHSVSSWPGGGRRSSSVCGMWLRGPGRAQQRFYLAAVPAVQKTVQGELRSAKGDARGQPEILALGIIATVDLRERLGAHHGPEGVQIRKTTGLAAVGQHFRGVLRIQIVGQAL